MEILGAVLLFVGISAAIQSFRPHDTMNEIQKANRDPRSHGSTMRGVRVISIVCLAGGAYLLFNAS